MQLLLLFFIFHLNSYSYLCFIFNFLFYFLAYEVPFICRLDSINKLLDEKALTLAEVNYEIAKLQSRDSCRLRGNDPFAMTTN